MILSDFVSFGRFKEKKKVSVDFVYFLKKKKKNNNFVITKL